MPRRLWWGLAVVAVLAGGALRFAHMPTVGLFAYDEAYFSEVVKTWRAAINVGAARLVGRTPPSSFGSYLLEHGGQYYTAAKPTFVLVGTLGSYLVGFGEHTLPTVSAIAGLLTIGLVFVIARRLAGLEAAAFSALALAMSCYHVIYSRSGFSLAVATCFVYAALALCSRSSGAVVSGWRLWWAGVCIGLAYTSHTSLFWVPPLFWGATLLAGRGGRRLRRLALLSVGMATPLVLWEGATRLVQRIILAQPTLVAALQGPMGQGRYLSYLQELFMQKHVYGGPEPSNPWAFYGGLLWNFERPVVLGLALIGALWGVKRLRRVTEDGMLLLVLGAALIPWLIFGVMPHYPVARVCVPAIPALAILCGFGAHALLTRLARQGGAAWATAGAVAGAVAVLALGLPPSWHAVEAHSGFPDAIAYMAHHEGVRHLSSNEHLSRVYVGRANATDLHVSIRDDEADPTGKRHIAIQKLEQLYQHGYRYVLLDGFRYRFDHELIRATQEVRPVFAAPHSTRSERYVYDVRNQYRQAILRAPEVIEVYRLDDLMVWMRHHA